MKIELINLDKIIKNPYQPREEFPKEEIQELSENILSNGLLNPIIVRKQKDKYQIVDGERRFRACQLTNIKEIEAYIKEYDSELQFMKETYCLNVMRKDFNPLENAKLIKQIWIASGKLSPYKLSLQLGVTPPTIYNAFNLLEAPEEVKQAIKKKKLGQGSVTFLSKLPEKEQIKIAKEVIKRDKRTGQIPIAKRVKEELDTQEFKEGLKKDFVKADGKKLTIKDFIKYVNDFLYNGISFYKRIPYAVRFMDPEQRKKLAKNINYTINILETSLESLEKSN